MPGGHPAISGSLAPHVSDSFWQLSKEKIARFAAKEAGMKALGTGWRGGLGWRDLEVVNLPSGRPTLQFHAKAAEIAEKLGVRNIALSITHTAEQAMAIVILEN